MNFSREETIFIQTDFLKENQEPGTKIPSREKFLKLTTDTETANEPSSKFKIHRACIIAAVVFKYNFAGHAFIQASRPAATTAFSATANGK